MFFYRFSVQAQTVHVWVQTQWTLLRHELKVRGLGLRLGMDSDLVDCNTSLRRRTVYRGENFEHWSNAGDDPDDDDNDGDAEYVVFTAMIERTTNGQVVIDDDRWRRQMTSTNDNDTWQRQMTSTNDNKNGQVVIDDDRWQRQITMTNDDYKWQRHITMTNDDYKWQR